MGRRAVPLSVAALVVLAGLLETGCVIEQPPPGPATPWQPPPLTAELQQQALEQSKPPRGVVLAERQFASGVWDFRTNLQRLLSTGVPPGDNDMEGLLVLFAYTLERTPEGEAVGVSYSAAKMREAARQMPSAGPAGSPPVRDVFGVGLREGVYTLLALADGPYGNVPRVVERAEELRGAFDPTYEATPPINYTGMLEVMRKAEFIFESILEARGITASP